MVEIRVTVLWANSPCSKVGCVAMLWRDTGPTVSLFSTETDTVQSSEQDVFGCTM
jgi:hypothetical protein